MTDRTTDLLLWNQEPVARSTDPQTSWEAARSVRVRESQELVLHVLMVWGPMTDEQLVERLTNRSIRDGRMSPSGARTRRSELVDLGLVVDTGQRTVLASGRRAIVWRAA